MYPHWTENDVLVDGAKFHYYRTGDGSKPALVLAHGFSDNGLCWLPVARDLEAKYDIILPDARGHGKSERVQPGEKIDGARDLAGLIQALNLKRPVVGGHSMGGSTAAALGARWAHLVSALILEDPGWHDPKPVPGDPGPSAWFEWLKAVGGMTDEEVKAKGRADNPTWPEIEMGPWVQSKKQLDLNMLKILGARRDWREGARAIVCPALLITADVEKGAIVTPETAGEACRLNSFIQVTHIPGAGHNIRRERFAEYMDVVKKFLGMAGA